MPVSTRSGNTTTLAGIAKEIYPISEIKRLEQLETKFKQKVKENPDLDFSPSSGGTFKFATQGYLPHGQRMINEQEALPTARASNIVQGTATVKEYAGVLQFTKRELELASRGGADSVFYDVKTLEMKNLITNAGKYFNRQMANGTGNGTITTVVGAQSAETTIEVLDGTRFQIGMVIDIYNAAGTVKQADGVVITALNFVATTNTITVDTAVTCDDLGLICLAGVKDNMSTDGKEMLGLTLFVDDGTLATTFQGINRSTNPLYQGISVTAAGAPLSSALVNQLMSRAYRIGGVDLANDDSVYFLCSPEQWRAYNALAIPQYRFAVNDAGDLNKNYRKFEIMGKEVVVDTDVSRTVLYAIREDACALAVACPLDWEEDLGGSTLKWLSGYAQGIMVLYALQQHYCTDPHGLAALTNLASVSI